MSDSEGEERSTFVVPEFKEKNVEFEPQLLAFVNLIGCAWLYTSRRTRTVITSQPVNVCSPKMK